MAQTYQKTFEGSTKKRSAFIDLMGSMRAFFLIWFGRVISIIGSGMTGFALGVYVYQRTGSASNFALILLFNMLPRALFSPLAGVVADRWDRRWIMILSDVGAAISTLAVAGLLMAALGEKLARNRGGYPTVEALTALAEQLGLIQVHSSRVFLGYEAVFQKASG